MQSVAKFWLSTLRVAARLSTLRVAARFSTPRVAARLLTPRVARSLFFLGAFSWLLSGCILLEEPKKEKTSLIDSNPVLQVLTENLNNVDLDATTYLIVRENKTKQQVVVPNGQVNFSFPQRLAAGSAFQLQIVQNPAFQRCGFAWNSTNNGAEEVTSFDGRAGISQPVLSCGYLSYPVQVKLYGVAQDKLKDLRATLTKTDRFGKSSKFDSTPTQQLLSFSKPEQRLNYADSYSLTVTNTAAVGAKTVVINGSGIFNNVFAPPKDSAIALVQPASGDLVTAPLVQTPAASGIFSYSRIQATVGVCPFYNPLKTAKLWPTKDYYNSKPSDPTTEELVYSSSDPSVATVDPQNGMITLQKAGTATITVRKAEKTNPFYAFTSQSFVVEALAPTGALRIGLCPARVELAQNLSLDVHNNNHSKTPLALRKKTLVRVFLTPSTASASEHPLEVPVRSRSVKALIKGTSTVLFSVNLTCPQFVMPLNEVAFSKDWTCYGVIPENTLTQEVRFVVDISDDSPGTFEVTPEFYDSEKPKIVIIPTCYAKVQPAGSVEACAAGTNSRNMTDAELYNAIYQAFPLAQDAITIHTGSNWIIPADLLEGSSVNWDETLDAFRSRTWEMDAGKSAPYPHYLAFIYTDENTFRVGTLGIAYLGSAGRFKYGNAALATDMPRYKKTTAIHELGHSFSLHHAPCNFSTVDPAYVDAYYPNWPKDSALAGAGYAKVKTAAYDPLTDEVSAPDYDIMSYCSGETLSPYGLAWTSIYLNPQANAFLNPGSPLVAPAATLVNGSEPLKLLSSEDPSSVSVYSYMIGGKIEKKSVAGVETLEASFTRVRKTSAPLREASGKDYLLQVIFEDGRVFKQEFSALRALDNGEKQLSHFLLSAPDWGKIARLELLENGKTLAAKGAMPLPATSNPLSDASKLERLKRSLEDDGGVSLQISGDQLNVRWNNQTYPWMTLVFVASDGKREVLLMEKTGGLAAASIAKLGAGGKFEISLSDGLNSILITQNP